MTRPSDPGFDVRISDWLEADPNLAPPDLMRTVESALPSIPQRRAVRLPWRFPPMSTFAKVAVAAVAVIAIGAVGIFALQPRSVPGVGAGPSPSASPSPSTSPSPSASPSPTAAVPSPAPLGETFTSPGYGFSVNYPTGWREQPATTPWTTGWPDYHQTVGDVFYDPVRTDHLFIAMASQPLAGASGDAWVADVLSRDACGATAPVTIDGAAGLAAADCNVAAVTVDGRGYFVTLYTSDDEPWLSEAYDRAWFDQLLATIDLRPEDAASPAPSP